MGPLRFHTVPNNSQDDVRLPSSHVGRIQACLCIVSATKQLIYAIHNITLFSKFRAGIFPITYCGKPSKMHTVAKHIISHKFPPPAAYQTESCSGCISVADHTYSNTSCSTSSGRLLMCKLLPIIIYACRINSSTFF